jgi:proteic killer suppression protein
VIRAFRHKGLERFFTSGDGKKIDAKQRDRIQRILDRLDACAKPEDLNLPGFDFHTLKGDRKGTYSVSVSGNWRITFRHEAGDATEVNLEDYH